MSLEYSITYKAENHYDHPVKEASWQFLILPDENSTQNQVEINFNNSLNLPLEFSHNAYGFRTIRISAKEQFMDIVFEAHFSLVKEHTNPFNFQIANSLEEELKKLHQLEFKVDFEPFLRKTSLTNLLEDHKQLFLFKKDKSLFENLQELNKWVFEKIFYTPGTTHVGTVLDEIVANRHGVCQDFSHLFCALARQNGIPARYVSGYLHQGIGYFGDSQMHAWAEAYMPEIGWIGFDPTNNLIANDNHIKVAHGKDYADCAPLKGVVYSKGENRTTHSVQVSSQQQQ